MKKTRVQDSSSQIAQRRRIQQAIWSLPLKLRALPAEVMFVGQPFITTWRLTAGQTLNLPLLKRAVDPTADYNCVIDWGDATATTALAGDAWPTSAIQHTYAGAGDYQVTITGKCVGFRVNNQASMRLLLRQVNQWGGVRLGNANGYFSGCSNLRITATDTLMLGATTNLQSMFGGCSALNDPITFDTTNVTNMGSMFQQCLSFNQPLGFDTVNVTNMMFMFYIARAFNQPLTFNTLNVTNMSSMFNSATNFNQPLNLNTLNVTSMDEMFTNATNFNQPLNFHTLNVTNMSSMFNSATNFNQPLNFDTRNVTNMASMFAIASQFNQPIAFDIRNVSSMTNMLALANSFSTANYSAMLVNFAGQTVKSGVRLDATTRTYNSSAVTARTTLTSAPNNWIINDGGLV